MKKLLTSGVLAATCFAMFAAAQGDWYRDREQQFRDEHWKGHVFAQVRDDLEHVYSARHAAPRERERLDRTRQELTELQAKLDHNVWDNGRVNDVIDSLRKSSNDQRLAPRDRDVIADDLHRIQDLQNERNSFRH